MFEKCRASMMLALLGVVCVPPSQAEPLTLTDAVKKTLAHHPTLQVYDYRQEAFSGLRRDAELGPPVTVGLEAENLLGTGDFANSGEAEWTISLSSVIELGEKRHARTAQIDAEAVRTLAERQRKALGLLSELASQFVSVLEISERIKLAREGEALATETIQAVERRVRAGASPQAELYRARALSSQSRLRLSLLEGELRVATNSLSPFWNQRGHAELEVIGDLFAFGETKDFPSLLRNVANSPDLVLLASEERVRKGAVNLVKSQSVPDVQWTVGARRLNGPDESALVASIEVPLFYQKRSEGRLTAREQGLNELALERDRLLNDIYARLYSAYEIRMRSIAAVRTLQSETLPALTQALSETRLAYDAGRYNYLDLIAAQRALLEAKEQLISNAATAQKAGISIELLTGVSLTSTSALDSNVKENNP